MDNLFDYYNSLDSKLKKKSKFNDSLKYLEKVTGIPRTKLFLGAVAIVIFYIIFGPYAITFVNILGFLYPSYESLNMIESREKIDDIKWMTYWAIYSYAFLMEHLLERALTLIPFYAILKCGFLLNCMISHNWNGSLIIYKHVLRPLILQNKKNIDQAVSSITSEAKEFLTKVNTH